MYTHYTIERDGCTKGTATPCKPHDYDSGYDIHWVHPLATIPRVIKQQMVAVTVFLFYFILFPFFSLRFG